MSLLIPRIATTPPSSIIGAFIVSKNRSRPFAVSRSSTSIGAPFWRASSSLAKQASASDGDRSSASVLPITDSLGRERKSQ